jgi:hypothetical protein
MGFARANISYHQVADTGLHREGTPIPEILKTVKISKSTLDSYPQNET